MKRRLLLLACLILSIAGCGGGDSESERSKPSSELTVILSGGPQIEIPFNSLWEDPGVTVTGDNADSASIVKEGEVDTSAAGNYEITYTATTTNGESDSAVRVVTVNPQQFTLTLSSFGDGTINIEGGTQTQDCTSDTCRISINEGATVQLTPTAADGYTFKGWEFCDSVTNDQCEKTVTSNTLVSATFLSTAQPVAKSNIVTLSEEQIKAIQNYDADSDIIEFKPSTDLNGIDVGTVMISKGVFFSDNDPQNIEIYFARRVRELIVLNGATIIVKTVKVPLSDIFDSGTLSTAEAEAKKTKSVRRSASYSLPIDVKLHDNFVIQGQISFSANPSYDIEFSSFGKIKNARALVRLSQGAQLTLQIKDEISYQPRPIHLATKQLTPIIIPTPISIPVVLVPEVKFSIVPKAVAEAAINPSVSISNNIIAGATYSANNGWTNLGDFSQSTTATVGQVKGRAATEAILVAEVSTKIYDLAGPMVSAGPGAGLEAILALPPTDDCVFEYGSYFKLAANVGGEFSAFGSELKYEAKVIDKSFPVGGKRCMEDTEPPTTPTSVTAEAISNESINVGWDASEDNVRVAHYEIWRKELPSSIANRLESKWIETEFTDNALESDQEYCYFLYAVDGKGNVSEEPSQHACATTLTGEDVTAPTPPANLNAEALSTSAITLTWHPSSDDVEVTSYVVYEELGNQRYALNQVESNMKQYDVGGLTADTEYCFSVVALDAAGNTSEASNIACATTKEAEMARWTMRLACQRQTPIISEPVDLDENVSSRVDVAGVGTDYNGTGLSYILNGDYTPNNGNITARITWRFENTSRRRVDEFTANLSSGNTGRVVMDQIEVTGCTADIQFIREDQSGKVRSIEPHVNNNTGMNFGHY